MKRNRILPVPGSQAISPLKFPSISTMGSSTKDQISLKPMCENECHVPKVNRSEPLFKNKNANGTRNICGAKIGQLRKEQKWSQRALAAKLQLQGIDVSKNAIQQIESGERFVTDIELKAFGALFGVSVDSLLV